MSVEKIIENFSCDITITRARYAELLIAEHDANCLKDLIHQKAKNYESVEYSEVKLLDKLYFYENESEEKENGNSN